MSSEAALQQWGQLVSFLAAAEQHTHGELTLRDVHSMVSEHKAIVLVMMEDGIICLVGVVEVLEFPKKTVMHTVMLGGSGSKYLFTECRDDVARIARVLGADCVRGYVRPSVARLLRRETDRAAEIYSVIEVAL